MKTPSAKDEKNTDFEAWARLLICRKVPGQYQQLVNSEVVHDGAVILKHGDSFEVRVCDRGPTNPEHDMSFMNKRVVVTPFPP